MLAIRVHQFGGPEVMKLEETLSVTRPQQVVVSVRAVGVNPVDTYIRSGMYVQAAAALYTGRGRGGRDRGGRRGSDAIQNRRSRMGEGDRRRHARHLCAKDAGKSEQCVPAARVAEFCPRGDRERRVYDRISRALSGGAGRRRRDSPRARRDWRSGDCLRAARGCARIACHRHRRKRSGPEPGARAGRPTRARSHRRRLSGNDPRDHRRQRRRRHLRDARKQEFGEGSFRSWRSAAASRSSEAVEKSRSTRAI